MFLVYIFNNNVIEKKENLKKFSVKTFGLNENFNKMIKIRLEIDNLFIIENFNTNEFNFFLDVIYKIVPKNLEIFSKYFLNIWFLDNINTYRGWRHNLGLPLRGQRTWSNSNSCFNSNKTLRDFKLVFYKKFYGNIPSRQINIGVIAEELNCLWKYQWNTEWMLAKNSIMKQVSKSNLIKIDLYSMYNFQVMHPRKLKKLSKKQKQSFKKNHFSLGFEIGFSKPLLRSFNKLDIEESSQYSNATLIIKNEKNVKKNNIKIKKQLPKKQIKKKKKSVWDF